MQNNLQPGNEEVEEENVCKKSPIIRPRIKRRDRLQALEARREKYNKNKNAAGNTVGTTSATPKEQQQEDEESEWMIPGTPPETYLRPVRLRNKDYNSNNNSNKSKKEDSEEEESQSLLAMAKKEERQSLIYFGFNNRNVNK